MKKLLVSLFCIVVLTMGLSAGEKEEAVFPACYKIGGERPGTPSATINLLVNPKDSSMVGHGKIFWAVSPPLEIRAELKGGYVPILVRGAISDIVVVLTGYPVIKWPPHAGIGPVIPPNCHIFMVLSADWKTGSATLSFTDYRGKVHEFKDLPVKEIECFKKK